MGVASYTRRHQTESVGVLGSPDYCAAVRRRCGGGGGAKMGSRVAVVAIFLLYDSVHATPDSLPVARLSACATGTCATIMGSTPIAGTALTVTRTAAGNTVTEYTPGETFTLANSGGGQYVLYAEADGTQLGRENNAGMTVTAPNSGTLTLLGMRAAGYSAVTYQKFTMTSKGGAVGGGGNSTSPPAPPPGAGAPAPPWDDKLVYTSEDGRYTVRWNPSRQGTPGTMLDVRVTARSPPDGEAVTWVGFAFGHSMLGDTGTNLALVGTVGSSGSGGITGYKINGKHLEDVTTVPTSALQGCGVAPDGQSVTREGTDLVMAFTLRQHNSKNALSCSAEGVTLPSLSVHTAAATGIVLASGDAPSFGQHPHGSYALGTALSADGTNVESHGGRGPLMLGHAFCMVLAWVVLAPGTFGVVRYGRDMKGKWEGKWVILHKGLAALTALVTLVGFIIGFVMHHGGGHFHPVHAKFGLIFFLLFLFQPLLGLLRPATDSPKRATWKLCHQALGGLLLVFGPIICLMGTLLTAMGPGLFAVLLMVILVGVLYGLLLEWQKFKGVDDVIGGDFRSAFSSGSVKGDSDGLPRGWIKAVDKSSGETYYTNTETGETQWQPPQGAAEPKGNSPEPPMPPNNESPWSVSVDASSGQNYYYNRETGCAHSASKPSLEPFYSLPYSVLLESAPYTCIVFPLLYRRQSSWTPPPGF